MIIDVSASETEDLVLTNYDYRALSRMPFELLFQDGKLSPRIVHFVVGLTWRRDESFNSITGLNGSGKSNILDAICFVLGITNMSTVRAQNLQVCSGRDASASI